MVNSLQETTLAPAVAVVQESLEPYTPFVWSNDLLKRARTPELVKAYLRWQYVRRGGVQAYTHLAFAPTGWEGYIVGLPPEQQATILKRLGEELMHSVTLVGKQAVVPADQLLAELFEEKFTRHLAQLIDPVFHSALLTMRGIGSEGFDMQAYSRWRTAYEQEQYRLEQALHNEATAAARQKILDRILANQWALKDQLATLAHSRSLSAALYAEVQRSNAQQVATVMQNVELPLVVDTQAGSVRYVLPAIPGLNTGAEENLAGHAPDWYVILRNLPMLGHPLIRAAIADATQEKSTPAYP